MYNIGSTIEEQDGHQISVKAFSDENEISLPLELTEGRMAENSKEIVVARDLITGGILADCKVGDTVELALADTQRYTVVGLYEDAGFNIGSGKRLCSVYKNTMKIQRMLKVPMFTFG